MQRPRGVDVHVDAHLGHHLLHALQLALVWRGVPTKQRPVRRVGRIHVQGTATHGNSILAHCVPCSIGRAPSPILNFTSFSLARADTSRARARLNNFLGRSDRLRLQSSEYSPCQYSSRSLAFFPAAECNARTARDALTIKMRWQELFDTRDNYVEVGGSRSSHTCPETHRR